MLVRISHANQVMQDAYTTSTTTTTTAKKKKTPHKNNEMNG